MSMISRHTMSMEFTPGECVLCFEPDLSKARVLYNAKVIDVIITKDSKGHRKAEYMVHFQGWNSSWDRAVPENYIIKNSDRNRSLMRRLAEIARHVKKNKSRMRRIDNILKEHFKERPKFDSDSSSVDTTSSEDTKSEEDENGTEAEDETDTETDNDHTPFTNGNGNYGNLDTNEDDGTHDDTQAVELELEDTEYKEIELELPGNLRRKLEYDCMAINQQDKLVKLPADTNVITVLESYVKNFGVNVLCATVEKSRSHSRKEEEPTPPEKNVDLCKEVMDGLRIFFDFALPTILLYGAEKEQWEKLMSITKPLVPIKSEDCRSTLSKPQCYSKADSTCSPKQSPRAVCKREEQYSDDDEGPPRRITRKAFAEELRRTSLKGLDSPKHNVTDNDEATPGQSASKKARTSVAQTPESPRKPDTKPVKHRGRLSLSTKPPKQDSVAQKVAPSVSESPAPVLPVTVHGGASSTSSNVDTPTSSALEQSFFRHRERAVNDLFSWKMLPDEEYSKVPTPPSLIYGAHHLLRLFVNLPEYLGRMPFPRSRLKYLVKHLELFMGYLSTRCNDLLPDTVYVERPDDEQYR